MNRGQRITAAVAAVALVLVGAVGAFVIGNSGQSPQTVKAQDFYQDRGISVNGEGQISVTPDIANVLLGVELRGSNLEDLRSEADSRMNEVIDSLQELGIDEADIQTVTYDIYVRDEYVPPIPERDEPATDEDVVTQEDDDDAVTDEDEDVVTEEDDDAATEEDEDVVTDEDDDAEADEETTVEDEAEAEIAPESGPQTYVLVQLVQVRITDIDTVSDVIDTALDNGANRVANIYFEVEDRQAAVEQAREMAVEEARAKAEHLAELTGVSLGAPLKIDESSPSGPPRPYAEVAAMDADMADEAGMARIEPGDQMITVSVYITYSIE